MGGQEKARRPTSQQQSIMRGSSKSTAVLGMPFPSLAGSRAAFCTASSSRISSRALPPARLHSLASSSPLLPLSVLSSQRRHYAVKSKNFERREARYDFSEITNRVWPRHPPPQIDYRNYVPAEEADEEDDWKPEEDYPEPAFTADQTSDQFIYPVITPQTVPVKIDNRTGAFLGTGRRKAAIARAALVSGQGKITINGRSFLDYFPCFFERGAVLAPFVAIERPNMFDVNVNVSGGGTKGQAEAIQLGIARALQSYNLAFRPALKKAGCLERDPRVVESKKAGRVKARKRPQWSKR